MKYFRACIVLAIVSIMPNMVRAALQDPSSPKVEHLQTATAYDGQILQNGPDELTVYFDLASEKSAAEAGLIYGLLLGRNGKDGSFAVADEYVAPQEVALGPDEKKPLKINYHVPAFLDGK